jgi:hypothetical protein
MRVLSQSEDGAAREDEFALSEAPQVKEGSIAAQFLTCGTRRLSRIGNERPTRKMGRLHFEAGQTNIGLGIPNEQ